MQLVTANISITPIYAALLALMYWGLSVLVIRQRVQAKVGIGEGKDQPALKRAIRAHANFIEYAPLALMLVFFVELQEFHALIVHGLAGMLVIGRLVHAYGISHVEERFIFRQIGMLLTFGVLLIGSGLLLLNAIFWAP